MASSLGCVAWCARAIGGVRDKLRIARLRRRVLTTELPAMFASPDVSAMEFLREFGFSPEVIQRFFRPFFGGVFLESELQTSCRMLQFVFRMFAAGHATLPAEGMGAIPKQLADPLPKDRLRLASEVTGIDDTTVLLASGERLRARTDRRCHGGPGGRSTRGRTAGAGIQKCDLHVFRRREATAG